MDEKYILTETEPEKCIPFDEENYVYAYCMCPLSIDHAIKINRIPGKIVYPFKCKRCGLEGTAYVTREVLYGA